MNTFLQYYTKKIVILAINSLLFERNYKNNNNKMEITLHHIDSTLHAHKTEKAYNATLKFVPNAKMIIGVAMPVLNDLAKKYKNESIVLVELLWKTGIYEKRMLAAKLLGNIAKKNPEKSIQLVKQFSKEIDNWAICDTLGMQSLKQLVKTHTSEIFDLANTLVTSKNLWQRRLSLVLVEWFTRDKQLHPAIKKIVNILKADQEYYVKKAIIWVEKNFIKGK
jgi:3-methyladenine DNA glycosylase AlkD